MKRAISIFLVLVLMFSLCLTGCNGTTSTAGGSQATASGAAPSGEPIRIGFEGWSSGADAYMGQVAEAILQDYIDDVNANGGWLGRPVELVAYDISKCALPGFVDSKNEEKTERNAGYLVVSHSGGGMLRQGTRKGIRRTPANRGMRAHRVVKGLDISEDVCHGMCP